MRFQERDEHSGTKGKVFSIDFDGVLHAYKSWGGPVPGEPPVEGALDFVNWLISEDWEVIVSSCRADTAAGKSGIEAWLEVYKFPQMEVTDRKPIADIYLDDRGFRFTGRFSSVRRSLTTFGTKTWSQK